MKRLTLLISLLVLSLAVFSGCGEDIVEDVKVSLKRSSLTIDKGQTEHLEAVVSPASTKVDLHWSSSDNSVAAVNSDGDVTGVAAGEAVITVSAGKSSATCKVTVRALAVQEVKLDKSSAEMTIGDKLALKATVLPADADAKVIWKSLNESVASVDASGNVEALAAGKATIVAEAGGKIAQCMITVKSPVVKVESVKITRYAETLTAGDKFRFEAVVSPEDATDKSVIWETSNKDVMTIDAEGNAEALSEGTVYISVRTVDGDKSDKCAVIVDPLIIPVASVEIEGLKDGEVIALVKGEKRSLTAKVLPADATDKSVVWSVSDDKVLAVTQNGEVTAVGGGTATVTVKTTDGGKTDVCEFKVTVPVESVRFDAVPENNTMVEETSFIFTAVVNPDDATDKTVSWSSSAPSVLSIDAASGEAVAIKAGTAVVKVTAGDKSAECSIAVVAGKVEIESVTITTAPDGLKMLVGEEFVFQAEVKPDDYEDKTVSWSSSNTDIILIDEEGLAIAVKPGKVVISASCGGKTDTRTITVEPKVVKVESVKINKYPQEMKVKDTYTFTAEVYPYAATDRTLAWESSNEEVLEIDHNGVATALAPGTVEVKVTTNDGGKTDKVVVVVIPNEIKVESVQITEKPSGNEMVVGEVFKFASAVSPSDASDDSVVWSTSDDKILSIKQDGTATALAAGEVTVTVTTNDGAKTDECVIKVNLPVVKVESVKISAYPSEYKLEVGKTFGFAATVLPEDATDKNVAWSSSAPSVLSIDELGNAKALAAGTSTVTVTTDDGAKTDKCTITVVAAKVPVKSVELMSIPTSNKMKVNDTFTFTARVLPENATDKSVRWSSSNESVLKIDSEGKATALAVGTASVTVTTNDGNKISNALITVVKQGSAEPVTGLTLTTDGYVDYVRHGKTIQIIPNYTPAGSYPGESKWYSSDSNLAVVDENGLVKAVSFDYSRSHSYYQQNGYPQVVITHVADDHMAVYKLKVLPALPERIVVSNPPPSTLVVNDTWDMGNISILPEEAEQSVQIICSYDGAYGGGISSVFTPAKVGVMSVQIAANGEHGQIAGVNLIYNISVQPIKETSITLSRNSYTLAKGSSMALTYELKPSTATYKDVEWSSSNPSVAVVRKGIVEAVSKGTSTISIRTRHGLTASCTVTVTDNDSSVKVGDFYYSDGTTSSELLSNKTPVGVVFSLLDAVASDPKHMAKDHPDCKHGLVVALEDYESPINMTGSGDMNTFRTWALTRGYTDFAYPGEIIVRPNANGYDVYQYYYNCVGYSTSKAYEEYSSSGQGECALFSSGGALKKHSAKVALPAATSGWFFPTLSEMMLLSENYSLINSKLKMISSSAALPAGAYDRYWTNTYYLEGSRSFQYSLSNSDFYKSDIGGNNYMMIPGGHSNSYNVRFIFAF